MDNTTDNNELMAVLLAMAILNGEREDENIRKQKDDGNEILQSYLQQAATDW